MDRAEIIRRSPLASRPSRRCRSVHPSSGCRLGSSDRSCTPAQGSGHRSGPSDRSDVPVQRRRQRDGTWLIVVDPQGGIPGFVVGPSVECGGSGHLISFVWYTAIVGHRGSDFRPEWTVPHPSHCRSTRLHRPAPSGSVRHLG